MIKSSASSIVALLTVFLCLAPASAQQDTGGDTGTQTGGIGGDTAGEAGSIGAGLDAATAFGAIERSETIGASTNTGAGFSEASEATDTGGGGIGGIGGLGGGFGGLGGFGGFGNMFGGGGGNTRSQTSRPLIRMRLRSAIDVQPIPAQQRQRVAARRLSSLPSNSPLRGLNVTVEGQTAVVTGVVQTERQRRMGELLLRLEPGIRNVDNRVIVAQ